MLMGLCILRLFTLFLCCSVVVRFESANQLKADPLVVLVLLILKNPVETSLTPYSVRHLRSVQWHQ